jgi:hypothetical protein
MVRQRFLVPSFEGSNPSAPIFSIVYRIHSQLAQLAERLTVNQNVAGSNPALGANNVSLAQLVQSNRLLTYRSSVRVRHGTLFLAGLTQMVESQPSKLLVAGSIPVARSR